MTDFQKHFVNLVRLVVQIIVLALFFSLSAARVSWARKAVLEPTATPAPEAKALFEKAQEAFQKKDYREAKSRLLQLVAKFPLEQAIPKSRLLLAQLEEDFEISLEQFKILAQEYGHQPEGEEAKKNLGARYYLADRYNDAASTYFEFLKNYPRSADLPEVRYWLGCSLSALGQDKKAQAQFEKCLKEDQGLKWAPKAGLALGNTLVKQRRYSAALKQYQALLERYPKFDEMNQVYLKRGRVFEALGKSAEAHASYRALLEKYPKSSEASEGAERVRELERKHPNLATARSSPKPLIPTPVPDAVGVTLAAVPSFSPTAVVKARAPFCLQVGVFSVKKYADLAMNRLKKAGYRPLLLTTTVPGRESLLFKVREGGYENREEALKAALGLERNLNLRAIVVEEP